MSGHSQETVPSASVGCERIRLTTVLTQCVIDTPEAEEKVVEVAAREEEVVVAEEAPAEVEVEVEVEVEGHAAALRAMDWRAAHGNRVISMGRAVLAVERHDRRWRCGVQPRAQTASAFAF